MTESREQTVDIPKVNTHAHAALSDTATQSVTITAAPVTGNPATKDPPSRERPTDKRVAQRHANAMQARAGHRRNIRGPTPTAKEARCQVQGQAARKRLGTSSLVHASHSAMAPEGGSCSPRCLPTRATVVSIKARKSNWQWSTRLRTTLAGPGVWYLFGTRLKVDAA